MNAQETEEPPSTWSARSAITVELAERYMDIESKAAELQMLRDEFYRDVTRLRLSYAPDSLAARAGVTRDAVYKWLERGRKLVKAV